MRSVPAGTGPHVLRRINSAAVLTALRAEGPLRIADLMTITELSRPAVTRAVDALRAEGWVADADADGDSGGQGPTPGADGGPARRSRVGRPAALLRFRAEAGHVLGVDVGPHKILAMVADLAGTVTAERRFDPLRLGDGTAALKALLSVISDVTASVPTGTLQSAAVGTPGIVDPRTGAVTLAPSIPGWDRIPIAATLRERLSCPVTVHNDVNLAVLAERWRGSATSVDTLVFLQWGARVGAGIMIDGRLHAGAAAAAGELGFLDLTAEPERTGRATGDDAGAGRAGRAADGEQAGAANGGPANGSPANGGPETGSGEAELPTMGPFERQVGAAAIIDLAIAEATRHGDAELLELMRNARAHDDAAALFDAAAGGNALAETIIDTICARLARGLAAVHIILDPDVVVIGGGLSRAGDRLLRAVERHLRQRTLLPPRLALSALGDTAVALGAVRSALNDVENRLLKPPPLAQPTGSE
jgi:predicted NBD/HSP70 family sugar kinase